MLNVMFIIMRIQAINHIMQESFHKMYLSFYKENICKITPSYSLLISLKYLPRYSFIQKSWRYHHIFRISMWYSPNRTIPSWHTENARFMLKTNSPHMQKSNMSGRLA